MTSSLYFLIRFEAIQFHLHSSKFTIFFRKSWWDDNQNLWIMIKESKNWTRWRWVNLNYYLLSNNDTDLVFLFKGSLSLFIHFSSTLIKDSTFLYALCSESDNIGKQGDQPIFWSKFLLQLRSRGQYMSLGWGSGLQLLKVKPYKALKVA